MDIETGREFSWTNPDDDPELYPTPPPGFYYDLEGRLVAKPKETPKAPSRQRAVPKSDDDTVMRATVEPRTK